MKGLGTLINIAAVLSGGLLGLLLGNKVSKSLLQTITRLMGIIVIVLGIQMALGMRHFLLVFTSVLIGTVLGEIINIQKHMEQLGDHINIPLFNKHKAQLTKSVVISSMLFCGGPMTILGSINDGLRADHTLLITKSILEGSPTLRSPRP